MELRELSESGWGSY